MDYSVAIDNNYHNKVMIDNSYHRVDSGLIFYETMAFSLKLKIRYAWSVKIFIFKAQKDKIWTSKLELIRVTNNTCFVWSKKHILALTYVVGITTFTYCSYLKAHNYIFFFQKMKSETLKNRKKAWFFCDLTAHFCCLKLPNKICSSFCEIPQVTS